MSKTLKGLQIKQKLPDGTYAQGTMKDIVITAVFSGRSENPSDSVRKFTTILPKLNDAKDEVEFEDNDFDIVKKSVEQNPLQIPDGFLGQALFLFEEKIEKK